MVISADQIPAQAQDKQPAHEHEMTPSPIYDRDSYRGSEKLKGFGTQVPMKRPGQPVEVGTCFVFLASEDASYMTGQVLHPNGGVVVGA
ncbi:MAG: SDR family oxidoreductase [Cyanobacteria bacterium J06634_6]